MQFCIPIFAPYTLFSERNVCFLKRIASGVLALIFTLALMLPGAAFASEPPETTTPYICLMDANTGAVLYEKAARDKTYPASTTKIMTCLLALEMCDNLTPYGVKIRYPQELYIEERHVDKAMGETEILYQWLSSVIESELCKGGPT